MIYEQPGLDNALVNFKARYQNFIGGEWTAPVQGRYFDNISPVNGKKFCEIPR
ncbi:aldehyde dehydrogenase, partial [Vibrio sp. 404]|nr:aldehyde dehydrogenase [Vibrio marinisediminis]